MNDDEDGPPDRGLPPRFVENAHLMREVEARCRLVEHEDGRLTVVAMCRIELAELAGHAGGDARHIIRIEHEVGIALGMHVSHRAADLLGLLNQADTVRELEKTRAAGLNPAIAGFAQQRRQPADFELSPVDNQQLRLIELGQQ